MKPDFCAAIEFTNNCNFRCPICPHSDKRLHHRTKGFITEDLFKESVKQCNRYARSVSIGFFGEQTLHPKFVDFIELMGARKFKLVINTNVSLCTREMMRSWIDSRVNEIRLSIDAINPITLNRCRPGSVKNLDGKIVPLADRLAAINEKVEYWLSMPRHRPTRIVYVRSSFNKNEEKNFIKYWRPRLKNKRDHLLLKQILSYGGKVENSLIIPHKCNIWDMKYLMIGWNGDVTPCNLDVNFSLVLGNITKYNILSLYNNNAAKHLRKMTGCRKNIDPCKNCVDSNNWTKNVTIRGL